MAVHICGKCKTVFEAEKAYIEHQCPKTGYTPADIEHGGKKALRVARAALKRTGSLTEELGRDLDTRAEIVSKKA